MSPPRIYLDTSIYLGILLGEKAALAYRDAARSKIFCSSTFLLLEAERNLVRLTREKILTEDQFQKAIEKLKEDVSLFLLKDVSLDLCLSSIYPPVRTPRSADLIHLRTALWFQHNQGLNAFWTLDRIQRECAEELQLPVEKQLG